MRRRGVGRDALGRCWTLELFRWDESSEIISTGPRPRAILLLVPHPLVGLSGPGLCSTGAGPRLRHRLQRPSDSPRSMSQSPQTSPPSPPSTGRTCRRSTCFTADSPSSMSSFAVSELAFCGYQAPPRRSTSPSGHCSAVRAAAQMRTGAASESMTLVGSSRERWRSTTWIRRHPAAS